eukprot:TRINITY_DN15630_c0_g2_i1.p1 TRINITY_DN15630_c0_g2~~TRINITY_DN15630_c0_g2_i1.p1  ORF type:complete len:576 (+),score=233.51 TRINITY_DN15630_c0_g2_i1:80-1807(+)
MGPKVLDRGASRARLRGAHPPEAPSSPGVPDVTVDFCERFHLVEFQACSLSFSNLERVVTYLLAEVSALRADRDKEAAAREAAERALDDRVQAIERFIEGRRSDLEEQVDAMDARLRHEETARVQLAEQLKAQGAQQSARSAALSKELAAAQQELLTADKVLERSISDLAIRVGTIGDNVRDVEETVQRLPVDTLLQLPAEVSALRADIEGTAREFGRLDGRIDDADRALRRHVDCSVAPLEQRISGAEEALQQQAAKGLALAQWRTDVDAALQDLLDVKHAGVEASLRSLQDLLRDLEDRLCDEQGERGGLASELRSRLEEAEGKLNSIIAQMKLRGEFVDEGESASGSALALLSQKVSDILSILILFESKLHKSEVNADRIETHLVSALQAVTAGKWSQLGHGSGSPRKPVPARPPRQAPQPASDSGGDDVPLLRGRRVFRCLSCNHPQRSAQESVQVEARPEVDPALPWGVLRSGSTPLDARPRTGLAGLAPAAGVPRVDVSVSPPRQGQPVVAGSTPRPDGDTPPSYQPLAVQKPARPKSAPYRRPRQGAELAAAESARTAEAPSVPSEGP